MRILRKTGVAASIALALALTACNSSEAPDEQTEPAPGQATGPDAQAGISASDARLILPVVAGNPGAAYFTIANDSDEPVSLAGAYIEGAGETQIHEMAAGAMKPVGLLKIEAKSQVALKPGETHVMVYDIGDTLADGGTSELTLTFEDGDKLSLPISIEARGGAAN